MAWILSGQNPITGEVAALTETRKQIPRYYIDQFFFPVLNMETARLHMNCYDNYGANPLMQSSANGVHPNTTSSRPSRYPRFWVLIGFTGYLPRFWGWSILPVTFNFRHLIRLQKSSMGIFYEPPLDSQRHSRTGAQKISTCKEKAAGCDLHGRV